jgi:hypothetical protein
MRFATPILSATEPDGLGVVDHDSECSYIIRGGRDKTGGKTTTFDGHTGPSETRLCDRVVLLIRIMDLKYSHGTTYLGVIVEGDCVAYVSDDVIRSVDELGPNANLYLNVLGLGNDSESRGSKNGGEVHHVLTSL